MKFHIRYKSIWTISLVAYIICNTAFSYGSLRILNTVGLYSFLGVSALFILRKGRVRLNFAAGAIVLYMLFALGGMLYTPTSSSRVSEVMYNYITMAVLSVCIVQYIESLEDIHTIITAYMVAGLALALYVYSIYGSSFWDMMRSAVKSSSGYVARLGKDLTNENTIAFSTIISAVIAGYYLVFTKMPVWKKVVYLIIAGFCFMVCMAAASKKSIIFMLVCLLCMWLYNMLGNRNLSMQLRNVVILICAVAAFLWMIYTLPIFSGIAARLDSLFSFLDGGEGTVSEVVRFTMIETGLSIWLENFLIGAGTASSIYYFGVYSHNNIVEILMNSGLIGFCIFYSVYLYAGKRYWKNAVAYKRVDSLPILLFSLFMGITICGIGMVYYYDRYYMYLLVAVFSAVQLLDSRKKEWSDHEKRSVDDEHCTQRRPAAGA